MRRTFEQHVANREITRAKANREGGIISDWVYELMLRLRKERKIADFATLAKHFHRVLPQDIDGPSEAVWRAWFKGEVESVPDRWHPAIAYIREREETLEQVRMWLATGVESARAPAVPTQEDAAGWSNEQLLRAVAVAGEELSARLRQGVISL